MMCRYRRLHFIDLMISYTDISRLYEVFTECEQKITTDTRNIVPGGIFFALKGEHFDANTFVVSAIEQGCRYAVTDTPSRANGTSILLVPDVLEALQQLAKQHRRVLGIPVIGITGSNGKTTNKELIHAVLSKRYRTYATKGNLNNHIGVPLTLLSLRKEHEMAIVEMGANHQGEIAFLSDLADPDFGLITNIGKAHLEGFGGVEGIKKGKSELYAHLRKKDGLIFINGNDAVLKELAEGLRCYRFGETPDCDVCGRLIPASEFVAFQWGTGQEALEIEQLVTTHMFGHYNFINLLCAAAIGHYFGVGTEAINEALSAYRPEMNRSQVIKTELNTLILDAYNANPSSMALAISNFAAQPVANKLLILGDMFELGEYAQQEHRVLLDNVKAFGLNHVLLVGSHFYHLQSDYPDYLFFSDSQSLFSYLKSGNLSGYTILVKGSRGMRLEGVVTHL